MSSSASLIPSPGVPGGNLLSSVPPPSELPSFIAQTAPPQPVTSTAALPVSVEKPASEPFYPTTFSPAIPPSKGIQSTGSTAQGKAPPPLVQQPDTGGGLFGWMKDAVSSGGILSKVAEKAKNSVDSMITTLDPQMREFICNTHLHTSVLYGLYLKCIVLQILAAIWIYLSHRIKK